MTSTPAPIEWRISPETEPYDPSVAFMEQRVSAIHQGEASEMVWLLEHPALYTAGTSADAGDLIDRGRFPVHKAGRGGQYTYHGPGQRIAYVMVNLNHRKNDLRAYVHDLEEWIIRTLATFGVVGERREGRVGIWVERAGPDGSVREDKIAAIGVRVRRWVTFHGIAINLNPDLSHFTGIVPCGISENRFGVTSLADLGVEADMAGLDDAMIKTFAEVFG